MNKTTLYSLALSLPLLALTACDLDIVPEGQSTLEKTDDLELLLNVKTISAVPYETLGAVVNESYGDLDATIASQLANPNSLSTINLTYDTQTDRAALTASDDAYEEIYRNINVVNVIADKVDGSSGTEAKKTALKAEAEVTRAYYHYLAANIYAQQYDASTAAQQGGVAYSRSATVDQKAQLTLAECYDLMLEDCSDANLAALPTEGNVNRVTQAAGNAIRAAILFQMKRYADALPYAEKALSINSTIEDRSYILTTGSWTVSASGAYNLLYVSPYSTSDMSPTWELLSAETGSLFEEGDYVRYHTDEYGENYWNARIGLRRTGIEGCLYASGWDSESNPWGITVEQMMYLAAECRIRAGRIEEGLNLVNKVRQLRIDADHYQPFTASTEQEAMELLQRAKFIECIASYLNFFDRKRWNSETAYKKTITRNLGEYGSYSIEPGSPLWVFPFPVQVINNNPTFRQNYE